MTVLVRNSQEYKNYTLDRLYGVLKTYELKMQQDGIGKGWKKDKSIALVASSQMSQTLFLTYFLCQEHELYFLRQEHEPKEVQIKIREVRNEKKEDLDNIMSVTLVQQIQQTQKRWSSHPYSEHLGN